MEKAGQNNATNITGYSFNKYIEETERVLIQNNDSVVIEKTDVDFNTPIKCKTEKRIQKDGKSSVSLQQETIPAKPKSTSSRDYDKQGECSKPSSRNEKLSKVILTHSPSHSLNFDLSSCDAKHELKYPLQSSRANQSIYKLAFDENATDQSETDSRSPSPIDPETQVPKSIINDEILIYEADSCSDAGSEDVELIPHRYESETFLNESKHMYVNKLSLAVELLRTQESLPYDEQFRRMSDSRNLQEAGFDSSSFDIIEDDIFHASHNAITSQAQARTGINNGVVDSFSFNEAKDKVTDIRGDSEGAGYHRFQVRHYLTSRANLGNPCLCCIIM